MIEVLSKSVDQIGIRDVESLIASGVPEGEQIEFKEELQAKGDGAPDPWMEGKNKIGDRASNEILEEVVAFANAHSGALLLGIKESDTKPPVAESIAPIPRCAELAERLKLVFRDCVEPQLPRIEILAAPTEGESGIVIIRAGRSHLAPHRVTKTLVCPIRRSDRCEKMTMREIQDMTLNVARGLERLERRLLERSECFQQEFQRFDNAAIAYGLRFSAAPVGQEVRFDRVFREGVLAEDLEEPWHMVRNESTAHKLNGPGINSSPWRPKLRAARQDCFHEVYTYQSVRTYREIHCDGLIELGFVSTSECSDDTCELLLSPDWPIVFLANLTAWANRVRSQALAPATEYAVDVEIHSFGRPATVLTGNAGPSWRQSSPRRPRVVETSGRLKQGLTKFPRYSLSDVNEVPSLLESFNCDFWNSIGLDVGDAECKLAIPDWPI